MNITLAFGDGWQVNNVERGGGEGVFHFIASWWSDTKAASSIDLWASNIYTVTNGTRYTSLHPNIALRPFEKVLHIKENVIFVTGERIEGDHLILTYADEAQYTREEDVEVLLNFPARPSNASIYTLTYVQVYVQLTSDETSAYFIGKRGGIGNRFCDILLACNETHNYGYQIYFYGY